MFNELTDKRKKEFKIAFEMFDSDKDGNITSYELSNVIRCLNLDATQQDINELIDEVNMENNGIIDFEDFVNIMNRRGKEEQIEEKVLSAFKVMDPDETGKISVEDLKHIMLQNGTDLSPDEVNEILMDADYDNDGFIDYEDFVKAISI